MISSQPNSFILPSLLGSWFINLSYGEFSKIVPVIGYSSVYSVIHSRGYSCGSKSRAACRYKSRISERENWNTFDKGFFQLPAVRTVAVFSLLFVDTNSVMVQLKKTIHPILCPSKGVVLHWYRDQGSDASLIWPQEEPHYCVPSEGSTSCVMKLKGHCSCNMTKCVCSAPKWDRGPLWKDGKERRAKQRESDQSVKAKQTFLKWFKDRWRTCSMYSPFNWAEDSGEDSSRQLWSGCGLF